MEMYNLLPQATILPPSTLHNQLFFTNTMFSLAGSSPLLRSSQCFPASTILNTIEPVLTVEDEAESASSPEYSPSPSFHKQRAKRGRPQQEIEDDEDPNSQKRKHRRLYARQYRAQMRSKIDEVKKLQDDISEMKQKHQEEISRLNQTILELLRINQQLIPAAMINTNAQLLS